MSDNPEDSWQRAGRGRATTLAVLAAVVVLAAGAAVWFAVEAARMRAGGAADNAALMDRQATAEVTDAVGEAVKAIFSYDYNNIARTERAANDVLVGKAVGQYRENFGAAKANAAQQQLVRTTSTRSIAVRELAGNQATVLLFVDQQAFRAAEAQHSSSTAALEVTARKVDGEWKIAELTAL